MNEGLNIIIYESSSKGGTYDYSAVQFRHYKLHQKVADVDWVIPITTDVPDGRGIYKILCDDRRVYKDRRVSRFKFLVRHFVNPWRLFKHLWKKEETCVIVLNDFEQLSSFLWVPLYKIFLAKHLFSVFLHDPDRDGYPPGRKVSEASMSIIMSLMKIGFYHEKLPAKNYYLANKETNYVCVPFGYYPRKEIDHEFFKHLVKEKRKFKIVTILGNIRMEKNYEMAISALTKQPDLKLMIAGAPASSSVNVNELKLLAKRLNVEDRVLWVLKYLTEEEMASVIEITDLILLNYKSSFKSQSAILNTIADYKKNILVSDTQSGLSYIVDQFKLGVLIKPDDLNELVMNLSLAFEYDSNKAWDKYLEYASWENNIDISVNSFKEALQSLS